MLIFCIVLNCIWDPFFRNYKKLKMIQAFPNDSLQRMSCGTSLIRVPEVLEGPYNLERLEMILSECLYSYNLFQNLILSSINLTTLGFPVRKSFHILLGNGFKNINYP